VIASRLPVEEYIPGAFAVPPNGLTHGIVAFGAVAISPAIALQGELSVPGELDTLRVDSHPGITFEESTKHRDTILSGLLRVRLASWCDAFVGGGLTFERTMVTEAARDHFSGGTSVRSQSSAATRATFTAGVDFPVRLHRHLALLPTGRMHVISRERVEPQVDVRPLSPPSKYVLRFGIGARVDF